MFLGCTILPSEHYQTTIQSIKRCQIKKLLLILAFYHFVDPCSFLFVLSVLFVLHTFSLDWSSNWEDGVFLRRTFRSSAGPFTMFCEAISCARIGWDCHLTCDLLRGTIAAHFNSPQLIYLLHQTALTTVFTAYRNGGRSFKEGAVAKDDRVTCRAKKK